MVISTVDIRHLQLLWIPVVRASTEVITAWKQRVESNNTGVWSILSPEVYKRNCANIIQPLSLNDSCYQLCTRKCNEIYYILSCQWLDFHYYFSSSSRHVYVVMEVITMATCEEFPSRLLLRMTQAAICLSHSPKKYQYTVIIKNISTEPDEPAIF